METLTTTNGLLKSQYDLTNFSSQFSGELLQQGDEGYENARKVWNGMIDKYPALIACCKNNKDVVACVNFARNNKLEIAVKGGGHNVTGNAVCNGGLMIDLSFMRAIRVIPEEKIAYVEAGATWGDFDNAAQVYKLATTGGIISTTGVAGLTLGGGVGWLVRKHGLSCDNLLEVEIVTADGQLLVSNTEDNNELFWGIRGCAPNFGIVTSMKFKLHKVDQLLGGMTIYPQSEAREVLQFYREFMLTAPEELTLYANLTTSPDGFPVIVFACLYSGDLHEGEAVLKPLREFKIPIADLIQPVSYVQMQSMIDAPFPKGNRYYWKSCFLQKLSDEAIDQIISNVQKITSPYSATILEFYGGAASREPIGGTSFPHRQAEFDLVIISNWIDKQADEKNMNWTRNFFEEMQNYSSKRVYVNTLGQEGHERVKEAFGESYDRLLALKMKYDPNNLFHLNQNILPQKQNVN